MADNKTLAKAKEEKNDEFYTQLVDIENELKHYKEQLKGKVILCNCDDPYESNFFKYFAVNFNYLGLKKLICTCYDSSPIAYTQLSLFPDIKEKEYPNNNRRAYKIEITEVDDYNGDGAIDLSDVEYLLKNKKNTLSLLKGNGDFRSQECIELLKQADVVVTNPPFSLFIPFINQLIEYNKRFVILGRMSALHYKDIFPLIQYNSIWIGYGFNLSLVYKTPYRNTDEANRKFVRSKGYDPDEGYLKVPAICWYTNLEVLKRNEHMVLYKQYDPNYYPKYENLDAIDVASVAEIPDDYYGMMGVPDSFLDSYNPEQFEIVGYGRGDFMPVIDYIPEKLLKDYFAAGGRGHVTKGMKSLCYYTLDTHEAKFPFSRIIIRRRRNEN